MVLTSQSENVYFGEGLNGAGSGFVGMGTLETRQWLRAIRDDTEPLVLPEHACRVTEILEAIYSSAASGEAIRF
jgi:predicted dehydrogenase